LSTETDVHAVKQEGAKGKTFGSGHVNVLASLDRLELCLENLCETFVNSKALGNSRDDLSNLLQNAKHV